ncbi:hypothetical protein SERLADRAFT_441921 [Serpula lacrymans var. lacrymans S7.9]|uniref:Uncharacterized protein n=1 Tax=Serpula lacrymans var. lacrymans (strain S7.9) TaxID=578457 RepID=F8P820_SERL9|nr:uncharacterized protein SERLADRAFT_441921 [Serpula lacrymans var. lacrymans S7.9]EGO20578.1 hypothetical protein SERLADRAFT_441921 [Serpula lacrymans var. lacrymans S7.9]
MKAASFEQVTILPFNYPMAPRDINSDSELVLYSSRTGIRVANWSTKNCVTVRPQENRVGKVPSQLQIYQFFLKVHVRARGLFLDSVTFNSSLRTLNVDWVETLAIAMYEDTPPENACSAIVGEYAAGSSYLEGDRQTESGHAQLPYLDGRVVLESPGGARELPPVHAV